MVGERPKEPSKPIARPEQPGNTKSVEGVASGLEWVRMRNFFYRDNYRRVMIAFLGVLLVAVVETFFIIYLVTHRPEPRYFATTQDGQLIPIIPLNEPNITHESLVSWVIRVATKAYTFNFVDYRAELDDVRPYFTTSGYDAFLEALTESDNLKAVKAQRLIVKSVASDVPVVVKEGLLEAGVYGWKISMPMDVKYIGPNQTDVRKNVVTLWVQRVPTLKYPQGIAISQFLMGERAADQYG